MDNLTNWLINIYNSYGFKALVVIVLTIVVTNLIKRPIVKHAETYARKYNVDKSVVTKWIALIPYALAFSINLVFVVIMAATKQDWNIQWPSYISDSALFASLSIAGFEVGKKCLESYVSRKEAKNASK